MRRYRHLLKLTSARFYRISHWILQIRGIYVRKKMFTEIMMNLLHTGHVFFMKILKHFWHSKSSQLVMAFEIAILLQWLHWKFLSFQGLNRKTKLSNKSWKGSSRSPKITDSSYIYRNLLSINPNGNFFVEFTKISRASRSSHFMKSDEGKFPFLA